MTRIEHIVLSGGAYLGLYEFGVLKYLSSKSFFSLDSIKTIHGTSVGGMIGAMLCLDINWEHIHDYIVKRPWYKIANTITPSSLLDMIHTKGLLGEKFFLSLMEPLLKTKDMTTTITLQEFYDLTKKELYLYTVRLNTFELVQLSYKTHPELSLIQAIHMTCGLPYIFEPVWYEKDESFYLDGGLINNYPIQPCIDRIMDEIEERNEKNERNHSIEDTTDDTTDDTIKLENIVPMEEKIREITDTILSLRFDVQNRKEKLPEQSNLFEYGFFIYRKMVLQNRKYLNQCKLNIDDIKLKNEIIIPCFELSLKDTHDVLHKEEKRNEYIQQGEIYAKLWNGTRE